MESGLEGGSNCGEEGDVSMSLENSLWYHSESDSASESIDSIESRLKLSMTGFAGLKRGDGRVKSTSESGVMGIPDE